MKTNLLIGFIAATFLLTSCGKEDKNKLVKEEPKNNFKVALDLIIKKDDSIQLFYSEEPQGKFLEENSLWMAVKGSLAAQEVNFDLPEDVVPANLRIDISKNEGQEPVIVNNFKIKYLDASFETKDSTMIYYFMANQIQYDPAVKTLTTVKDANGLYDPYIYTTELFSKKIMSLEK